MKTCLAILALVIVLNNSALAEKERVYVGPYAIEYDYGNVDHNIMPLPNNTTTCHYLKILISALK